MSNLVWPSMVVQRLSDGVVIEQFRAVGEELNLFAAIYMQVRANSDQKVSTESFGWTLTRRPDEHWIRQPDENLEMPELGGFLAYEIKLRIELGNQEALSCWYRRNQHLATDELIFQGVAKNEKAKLYLRFLDLIHSKFSRAGLEFLRTTAVDWGTVPAGLQELTMKLAASAAEHERQVAKLTEHFREEVVQRSAANEELLVARRKELEEEYKAKFLELDNQRKAMELLDARSSRRKSRQAIAQDLVRIAQLGLTGESAGAKNDESQKAGNEEPARKARGRNQLERSEFYTSWAALISVAVFACILVASIFLPVSLEGLEWLTTASRTGSALALAGSLAFLMRILTARETRLANERRRQERIFIDIARANWVWTCPTFVDTQKVMVQLHHFTCPRREIRICRMAARDVVKSLNIFRDGRNGFVPSAKIHAIDELLFERRKETLRDSIVEAASS